MFDLAHIRRSVAVIVVAVALIATPMSVGHAAMGKTTTSAESITRAPQQVAPASVSTKGRQLRITVKGQRFRKKATVILKGYRGRARGVRIRLRVRRTKTLSRLKPGRYRVSAKRVVWRGGVAKPKRIKPRLVRVSGRKGARTKIVYRQTKEPTTTPRRLSRLRLSEVRRRWGNSVSVAVAPLMSGPAIGTLGGGSQHAWSTYKVLVTAQILVDVGGPELLNRKMRTWIRKALSTSSNDTAHRMRDWLKRRHGGTRQASAAMTRLLRRSGDRTTIVAPGPTAEKYLGLTIWTPKLQALFLREVVRECVLSPGATSFLLGEMGHVVSWQSWGLGSVGSTAYKGGWGPDRNGRYLVRQFGVMEAADGSQYIAAISVWPSSGKFAQGTKQITRVARWMSASVASAPKTHKCKV